MDDDGDDYVGQLKEVFDRCDTESKGALDKEGLLELCIQLQLEDQSEQLVEQLLGGDTDGVVDFDTFKEAFVMILSSTVDFDADLEGIEGISDADDDFSRSSYHNPVSDADVLEEISPKYVKEGKKYGRKSKPDILDVDRTEDFSDVETDISSYAGGMPEVSYRSESRGVKRAADKSDHNSHMSKRNNNVSFADDLSEASININDLNDLEFDHDDNKDVDPDEEEPLSSPERVDGEGVSILETFEAEGQNQASISQYAGTPTQDQTQEAAIQAIWEEVGVGTDGFLDRDELKIVCEHIGMDDMDAEEMENLYIKLDEDKDGKVGFDEFLQGLFSYNASAAPTPIPIGMSPAQRSNMRRLAGSSMEDPYMRTATPSILVATSSKLFSMLDPDNSGYARPEDIAEQLEVQGIDNPTEVMEILDVNMEAGKVSLMDLSSRLENVLLAKGDDDGVFQTALTTCQSEIKYLRQQLDNVIDEREHLKADIADSNLRNIKLAQEIDDRHNDIQKSNEEQLKTIEEKYKGQIASLQTEIGKERDSLTTEEAGVRERLEEEIEQLKAEDAQLREKLAALQQEHDTLEDDLVEATERLVENEKTIQKQQRDLEGFQELEERLADLESNRESVSKQQEEYFESNINDYKEKIKFLQDKMDEVTQENELLKNQGSERKLRRRTSKMHSSKPGRIGSVLSDYVNKPNVHRRVNSSSENESELEELDPIARGQLPARSGGDGTSNEEEEMKKKLEEEKATWEAEMNKLKEELVELKDEHQKELQEANIGFEHQCKDIEEKYKIEIDGLEQDIELKKEQVRNEFDRVRDEFKSEQSKLVEELERKFNAERTETQEKYEREREAREESFAREKIDLRDKLEAEYNLELDARIAEVKQQLLAEKAELEKMLTSEKSGVERDLLKAKNNAEMKLKQREMDFIQEKGELEAEFGSEKSDLLQKYNAKVHELEQILVNGEQGLKGQLRQDFSDLLDKHKVEMNESFVREREELMESFEKEKDEINEAFDLERVELLKGHNNERSDLVERLQKEKAEMASKNKIDKLEMLEKHRREKSQMTEKFKKEKDALNEKHKKERSEWELKLQKERERFKKERDDREEKYRRELAALELNLSVDKDNLEHTIQLEVEDKIRQNLKREMEDDYVDHMQRLKSTFDDEKAEFMVEKEQLEDRLRESSKDQLESVSPVVAQQVHALQSPMPMTRHDQPVKMLSIFVQTEEDFPDLDKWKEEKRKFEEKLQESQQALDKLSTASTDKGETTQKRKIIHSGVQTSSVEMVNIATTMRDEDDVLDGEAEIEVGATDKIQKFFTGLFGDGPRAKGIQTERLDRNEQIIQTDIDSKYFGEKHILEQKLRDSEALRDEMDKTLRSMAFTEKAWAEARRMQSIDEDSQTDKIEMANCESMTDGLIEKKQLKDVFSQTDLEAEHSGIESDLLSEYDNVEHGRQDGGSHLNLQTASSQTERDSAAEEVDSLKALVAELEADKLDLEKRLEASESVTEPIKAEQLLAVQSTVQESQNDQLPPENDTSSPVDPSATNSTTGLLEGQRTYVSKDTQTVIIETTDNITSTTLDKMIEGAGDDSTDDDEETDVVDGEPETEVGATDKIQKFFTGLFGDGPRAKGIQTERIPWTERPIQTDIKANYFEEKLVLEEKLRDTQALSDEMAKSLHSMAYTEKAWEEAKRMQRVDEDSQTDNIEMLDREAMTDQDADGEENESQGFITVMKDGQFGSYDEEMDSLKAQVSQLESDKQILEGKLRASKALSEVMAASMQSMAQSEEIKDEIERLKKSREVTKENILQEGEVLPEVVSEESCNITSTENYHTRLIETEDGELQTVKIQTGRVGGGSTPQRAAQQSQRQLSDGFKEMLEEIGGESVDLRSDYPVDEVIHPGEAVVEEALILSLHVQPEEYQMPRVTEVPQMHQGTQTTSEGATSQVDQDNRADENKEVGPQFDVTASSERVELIEDEHGNLQMKKVKTGQQQKAEEIKQEEIFKEMAANLQLMSNPSNGKLEGKEVKSKDATKNQEIVEEAMAQQVVQMTEYRLPHMPPAIQIEQGIQVDIILTYGNKVHCGTEMDEMTTQEYLTAINASTEETNPGSEILQKKQVQDQSKNFELVEDEHGRLQRNKVKLKDPSKERQDVDIAEMGESLRNISESEKDIDEWVHIDGDTEHIQEDMVIQQEVQLTEFQMPHMSSALQKDEGVQVDMTQDSVSDSKSAESREEMSKHKDTSSQTLDKTISNGVTQTEKLKVKEAAVQLDSTKVKDQSSQWNVRHEIKTVQTVNDSKHVKMQTSTVQHKEKAVQIEKAQTEERYSQWKLDNDQMPVSKSVQTADKNTLVTQQTQTTKAFKVLTEVESVQVRSDNTVVSTQTAKNKTKDQAIQAHKPMVFSKSCQSTVPSDTKTVGCQSNGTPLEYDDEPLVQPHMMVFEESMPNVIIDTATHACQTAERLMVQTGTYMEPVDLQTQACQIEATMSDRSCQWYKLEDSMSMGMQTETRKSILSSVQTDQSISKEQGQQTTVEQTHRSIQHQVKIHHGYSQTGTTTSSVALKVTQTELLKMEDRKLQTELQQEHRKIQTDDLFKRGSRTQTDIQVKKEGRTQTESTRMTSVDTQTQAGQKGTHLVQVDMIGEVKQAATSEVAREEAIEISSVQQLHASQQDTSMDKSHVGNREQNLTGVSSMDESALSETTEGPDEILSPHHAISYESTSYTLSGESSEGNVMGLLRKAPIISGLLPEKVPRPRRRRKREKARQLPDIQSLRSERLKRRGTFDVSSEVKDTMPRSRRPSAPQLSDREGTLLSSENVQQKSKQEQYQSKRRPSTSGYGEATPQRTHGELNSQDSLFSRMFPSRDAKVDGEHPGTSHTASPHRRSSSATVPSSRQTSRRRPSDLGPLRRKPSEDPDAANPKSPLTEQVTSQKDKLTQMLNLLRDDATGSDPRPDHSTRGQRSPADPVSEELLHHKSVLPLESQGMASSVQHHPDAELHPNSSRGRYRQKPSDGQDAEMPAKDKAEKTMPSFFDRLLGSTKSDPQSELKKDPQKQQQTDLEVQRLSSRKNQPLSSSNTPQVGPERTDRSAEFGTTGTSGPKGIYQEGTVESPDDRASYKALAKQQDMLAHSVRGLEQKFKQGQDHVMPGSGSSGIDMIKQARVEMLEQSCDRLKQELSETSKKLLEAEMQLSIMEAQNMREIQRLKDKNYRETTKEVKQLKKEVLERNLTIRDLEKDLSLKADQLGQASSRGKDQLNQEVKEMRDQKHELEKKYRTTQKLLDEYMRKLKEQLTRSTRSDVLVKELYVENSKLQKALQVTEERQKIAERNCHNLREKNHAYLHVLRRVTPAAM